MKLDQSSVVHQTDGFRWMPERHHFLAQLQFQYKRLSEMTVRQQDPAMTQNPGESGHFRSKEAARSVATQLDGQFIPISAGRLARLQTRNVGRSETIPHSFVMRHGGQ
jgi:hypothetical protein